jgi:hypothetical protein
MLVESFILQAPHTVDQTGVVPYWTKFPVLPSAERLSRYLESHGFDDLGALAFSHGTDSIGIAPIERWRRALERAGVSGTMLAVDEDAFPRDFATFARYRGAVKRWCGEETDLPPLTASDVEAALVS